MDTTASGSTRSTGVSDLAFFPFALVADKPVSDTVTEPEILAILSPMIKHFALERQEGEHFGDFVIRTGYIAPTTEGKAWYDRMGGEGQHREGAIAA